MTSLRQDTVTGGKIALTIKRARATGRAAGYLEVLKPLPSILLAFIGLATAIVAASGQLSPQLGIIAATVLFAAAGANGLTNYLDRNIDARMERTNCRALPSKLINPAEKALPLIGGLIVIGLALSWYLHPLVFAADAAGTLVAATWRKKVTCVYPQGVLASCAPLFMGWLAIKQELTLELLLLCLLIAAWLPLHVWSVNIAHRDDYRQAGINYFPINLEVNDSVRVLLAFSLLLFGASIALYFVGDFSLFYLVAAVVLGFIMVVATVRLAVDYTAVKAWRLYRLSAFPYLGLLFLVMMLDVWLVQ